ncbi:hypothetical protein BDV93DRAFT_529410 [Ceratobasidium sp. AG-I]|nr:hypothetical protein BDV93DRAFT_529410 [Ceratobasidium sp. AG-I]
MNSHYTPSLQTGSRHGCTGGGPSIEQMSRSKNRSDTYRLSIQKYSTLYRKTVGLCILRKIMAKAEGLYN